MLEQTQAQVVRWGILGTARIARIEVIPAIQQSRNGAVAAIASRDAVRAAVVAQVYGIPRIYGSYAELLDDPAVDAVYIALPNHLHAEWTMRALQAGKHVLCEKPLAMHAEQSRAMVAVAREHGRHLMEAFMYRFHPRMQQIAGLVQQGALGHLLIARIAFTLRSLPPEDFRLDPAMGGGALLDVGGYGVNLARWLFGSEPESVYAYAVYGETGIDLTTVGVLRFPGGRIATLEASFATAHQQAVSLIGTSGTIELPHDTFAPGGDAVQYMWRGATERVGEQVMVPAANQYQLMAEHFADAVLGNGELAYPPEDSICTMRVLDALARAALDETPVLVPDQPCDPLHEETPLGAVAGW